MQECKTGTFYVILVGGGFKRANIILSLGPVVEINEPKICEIFRLKINISDGSAINISIL